MAGRCFLRVTPCPSWLRVRERLAGETRPSNGWRLAGLFVLSLGAVFFPKESIAQYSLSQVKSSRLPQFTEFEYAHGAIIRGSRSQKTLALVFTGDSFGEGGEHIRNTLKRNRIKASFFLTGNFYRNPDFKDLIWSLRDDGHYLGAHSDRHLLYCSWENRDSLLVTREEFEMDLKANYEEMAKFGLSKAGLLKAWPLGGIKKDEARYFLPPFEWYNETIAAWCREMGITLVNFTPGTKSHADWTVPDMGASYYSSETIYESILRFEREQPEGLNGFILLSHIGTHPDRTDKFYLRLGELIEVLRKRGYEFKRIDELLEKT